MVKEVTHLTMILVLDKDHTHYRHAFRNIFKEDTLHKKHFPDGPDGIKMRKGGAAHAIVCRFCPYACLNNDYVYCHLVTMHLNLHWGRGICFEFVNEYLSKIREHVQSHQKKSSREQSCSSHKKDEDEGSGSSSDGISSDKEGSISDSQDEEDDGDGPVLVVMESAQMPQTEIPIGNPTSLIPFIKTTGASLLSHESQG